jgi:hypothetical protein
MKRKRHLTWPVVAALAVSALLTGTPSGAASAAGGPVWSTNVTDHVSEHCSHLIVCYDQLDYYGFEGTSRTSSGGLFNTTYMSVRGRVYTYLGGVYGHLYYDHTGSANSTSGISFKATVDLKAGNYRGLQNSAFQETGYSSWYPTNHKDVTVLALAATPKRAGEPTTADDADRATSVHSAS